MRNNSESVFYFCIEIGPQKIKTNKMQTQRRKEESKLILGVLGW